MCNQLVREDNFIKKDAWLKTIYVIVLGALLFYEVSAEVPVDIKNY